jgi:hypothetical protein
MRDAVACAISALLSSSLRCGEVRGEVPRAGRGVEKAVRAHGDGGGGGGGKSARERTKRASERASMSETQARSVHVDGYIVACGREYGEAKAGRLRLDE